MLTSGQRNEEKKKNGCIELSEILPKKWNDSVDRAFIGLPSSFA